MSYRSANPFSAAAFFRWLAPIAEKLPHAYLGSVSALALFGYLVLLSIPAMAIVSITSTVHHILSLTESFHLQGLVPLGIWSVLAISSSIVCIKLIRMKLPLPQGLMIKTGNFPPLHTQLQKLYDHFQIKPVSRVTITERYEICIVYTPRFGLPLWPTATLCLGLPVLQSLSTHHFNCLLTGQIGQHAAPYSRWLHQLKISQQLFKGYKQYFDKDPSLFIRPLRLFFSFYQPAFNRASVFVSHWDELEADRYSIEIYSGADLLESMLSSVACQQFLQKNYWPEVVKCLLKESPHKSLPHTRMNAAIRRALSGNKTNAFLHDMFNKPFDGKDHTALLKKRMENIGYNEIKAPAILIKNASHELLGDEEKKIIEFIDKIWVSRNLTDWKKAQQKRGQKQAALASLEKQSNNRLLTTEELWQQARLIEKLHGENAAIPFYKTLLQKDKKNAKAFFAFGRILLRRGEANGIELLEQSMRIDSSLTPQACMLLFKFLSKHNQKERAMQYRNKGLSFRQQHAA